jgi:hypothetical protein
MMSPNKTFADMVRIHAYQLFSEQTLQGLPARVLRLSCQLVHYRFRLTTKSSLQTFTVKAQERKHEARKQKLHMRLQKLPSDLVLNAARSTISACRLSLTFPANLPVDKKRDHNMNDFARHPTRTSANQLCLMQKRMQNIRSKLLHETFCKRLRYPVSEGF